MRIAYITDDPVNLAVAAGLAKKCGAALAALRRDDDTSLVSFDAVLYDLDGIPPHERSELLGEIIRASSSCPRAVHGYALDDDQARSLRLSGVAVAQRLQLGLIRALQARLYKSWPWSRLTTL